MIKFIANAIVLNTSHYSDLILGLFKKYDLPEHPLFGSSIMSNSWKIVFFECPNIKSEQCAVFKTIAFSINFIIKKVP